MGAVKMLTCMCVSQYVQEFQAPHRIFCTSSQFVCPISSFFTCIPPYPPPPPPRPLPPPRGPARCWKRRCPGVSRLRWGSAPPGHDTTPKHTSSSSPSPVERAEEQKGQHGESGGTRAVNNHNSLNILLIWLVMTMYDATC